MNIAHPTTPNKQKEDYVFTPFSLPLDPRLNPHTTLIFAKLTDDDRKEMRGVDTKIGVGDFDFSFSLEEPQFE